MLQIILAILAFGVLVIVHEFGHFITAKRGGVQVNEFWIGMGPTLLKHEHKGTLYCLKLLPFGGACVMEGEDGESENEHAFGKAKLPRRMLIVCAGALMNFLVGFLIVLAVMQPNGPNGGYIVSTIASVDPASTAAGDLRRATRFSRSTATTSLCAAILRPRSAAAARQRIRLPCAERVKR